MQRLVRGDGKLIISEPFTGAQSHYYCVAFLTDLRIEPVNKSPYITLLAPIITSKNSSNTSIISTITTRPVRDIVNYTSVALARALPLPLLFI